ncbi:hypothetical protein [uncultured Dokdonia sp.]|uniref:hypothetical protein n=1 Tax=uncultured Dokdonia sp. TaxID=575653 RepID=UPI00262207F3|nr:hypothetical protein [uncultured Dokdonia sp.]
MIQLSTLFSGIKTADSLVGKVLSKKGTRIQNKVDAVSTMQLAINATKAFLVAGENNYEPNLNLSTLWLSAFTAMIKIDKALAERLRQKSKFWSNPQQWLAEANSMELVPDLDELNEKCDLIMVELEKRNN